MGQPTGAEITQRQLGTLEHTAQPAGSSTSCRMPQLVYTSSGQFLLLPGSWSGFRVFQTLSKSLLCGSASFSLRGTLTFAVCSGRKGPSESSQFQGFPEAHMSCLTSYLRSLPEGWNVSVLEETITIAGPDSSDSRV